MDSPFPDRSPTVAVIIPAFNEAATVSLVLERVRACAAVTSIVVVDDGSNDGTSTVLAQCQTFKDVTIVGRKMSRR